MIWTVRGGGRPTPACKAERIEVMEDGSHGLLVGSKENMDQAASMGWRNGRCLMRVRGFV